jgi:ABC-type antimicrobial peptide transport system permease subunit
VQNLVELCTWRAGAALMDQRRAALYFLAVQRTRELGIRLALGSDRPQLRRMLVAQQLKPVAAGLAIGAGVAYMAAPIMAAQLHYIPPRDPTGFGAASVAVFVAAMVACYVGANQATKIDIIEALRRE